MLQQGFIHMPITQELGHFLGSRLPKTPYTVNGPPCSLQQDTECVIHFAMSETLCLTQDQTNKGGKVEQGRSTRSKSIVIVPERGSGTVANMQSRLGPNIWMGNGQKMMGTHKA
jgi:hypothetical protein